jgi:hypothetical protein
MPSACCEDEDDALRVTQALSTELASARTAAATLKRQLFAALELANAHGCVYARAVWCGELTSCGG